MFADAHLELIMIPSQIAVLAREALDKNPPSTMACAPVFPWEAVFGEYLARM